MTWTEGKSHEQEEEVQNAQEVMKNDKRKKERGECDYSSGGEEYY